VITASVAIGSVGVPILHITVVLVSIPVTVVVAHDAAVHAETLTTFPVGRCGGGATKRTRSFEHHRSWGDAAGASIGLRDGLGTG
jgi:hypothetical protein